VSDTQQSQLETYSRFPMTRNHIGRRSGLALLALMMLLVVSSLASQAAGYSAGCHGSQVNNQVPPL
jgi:hypothetical protein